MKFVEGQRVIDNQGRYGKIVEGFPDYTFKNGQSVNTVRYKIEFEDGQISHRMEHLITAATDTELKDGDIQFINDFLRYTEIDLALSYGDEAKFRELTQQ